MGLALKKIATDPNNQTVIIGLGETGVSVARYLRAKGLPFLIVDTRISPPKLENFKQNFPDTEVRLGELSKEILSSTSQIIVSPGVDLNQTPIRDAITSHDCECVGDIELFARGTSKPIVAITGSNGKSTVTCLVVEMARSAGINVYAGGNLGPPALDLLTFDDAELFVLELSSFQLESTKSLQPHVSVVLNVSPDHLDRHGDLQRYARIKEQVYSRAKVSVINRNDPYVKKYENIGRDYFIWFG